MTTTGGSPVLERFETFTLLVSKLSRSIRKIKSEEMAEFKSEAKRS